MTLITIITSSVPCTPFFFGHLWCWIGLWVLQMSSFHAVKSTACLPDALLDMFLWEQWGNCLALFIESYASYSCRKWPMELEREDYQSVDTCTLSQINQVLPSACELLLVADSLVHSSLFWTFPLCSFSNCSMLILQMTCRCLLYVAIVGCCPWYRTRFCYRSLTSWGRDENGSSDLWIPLSPKMMIVPSKIKQAFLVLFTLLSSGFICL